MAERVDPTWGDRLVAIVGIAWERTRVASEVATERAAHLINGALDRVFAEPLSVPDAETALRMLASPDAPPPSAATQFVQAKAVDRLVGWMTRLVGPTARVTRTSAYTTAALFVANRTRDGLARGLRDLQVLSSFLAARVRAAELEFDPALLRAVTVSVYVDPTLPIDFRYRGHRAGVALTRTWSRDLARLADSAVVKSRASERVRAIEALDLPALLERWNLDDGS